MAQGLLNPWMMLGSGLLSTSGHLNPANATFGAGLNRGMSNLLGLQRHKLAERRADEDSELRRERLGLLRDQLGMQRSEIDRDAAAEVARQEGIRGLLASVPEAQRPMMASLLAVDPKAAVGLLTAQPKDPKVSPDLILGRDLLPEGTQAEQLAAAAQYKIDLKNAGPPSPVDALAGLLAQERLMAARDKREERERKREEAERKAEDSATQSFAGSERVLSDLREAKKMVDGSSTGFVGWATRGIPGTPAFRLEQRLRPVMSSIARDALNMQRELSATGASGFGALSERELALLESSIANLNTAQDEQSLRDAMGRVEQHYSAIRDLHQRGMDRARRNRMSVRPSGPAPATLPPVGGSQVQPPPGFTRE